MSASLFLLCTQVLLRESIDFFLQVEPPILNNHPSSMSNWPPFFSFQRIIVAAEKTYAYELVPDADPLTVAPKIVLKMKGNSLPKGRLHQSLVPVSTF